MYSTRRFSIFLFVLLSVTYSESALFAQESGGHSPTTVEVSRPTHSRVLLPLIVETIRREPQGEGGVAELSQRFWWGGEARPLISPTDQLILSMAPQAYLPEDLAQLSAIFKTPHLTLSNATALGKTYGASQVLLGTMQHNVYAEKPLGEPLQSFRFEGVLLDTSGDQPHMLRELSIKRTFLGEGSELEKKEELKVLQVVIDALSRPPSNQSADLFAHAVTSQRLTLALKGIKKVGDLQQVIQALESRADIAAANILWASDHVISLELIPKNDGAKGSSPIKRDELIAFLANHRFDQFQLDVSPGEDERLLVASRLPL